MLVTNIVMPALGMAQETGKLIRWLKREGESITKGEPIMEIETDKVTVEIEATASGTLHDLRAHDGDVIPVGQVIAWIVPAGERLPPRQVTAVPELNASPVARKIAEKHNLDLSVVRPDGGRVSKADVLAYLDRPSPPNPAATVRIKIIESRVPASPKARRLAAERQFDLARINGTGPNGAIIAADVPLPRVKETQTDDVESLNTIGRVMAERMTTSWTGTPHFYLLREIRASALIEMRARIAPAIEKRTGVATTYTDLLIKLVAMALRDHPRLNAQWTDDGIRLNHEFNIGLAVGIDDGLVVPVIHQADTLSLGDIGVQRRNLIAGANEGRLKPADIARGTFTLTNLGMYNVDSFLAILNPPQAAILAVGRITDRVVAENGQPVVRPTIILTLSCDHRVVDGVRAAKFLDDLTNLIEEPWGIFA